MRASAPVRAMLVSLVCLLPVLCHALPHLAELAAKDAHQDFYADVSEAEWRNWERDSGVGENATMSEQVRSVLDTLWPVKITVRLVGWNPLLVTALRAARLPNVRPLARPLGESDVYPVPQAPLRVQFSLAPASTLRAFEAARDADVRQSTLRHAEISPDGVEAALEADLATVPAAERSPWVLYLVNSTHLAHGNSYVYASDGCGTALGVSGTGRFGWVDQAAGPCEWGPVVAGLGHVDARHLPLGHDPRLPDVLAFVHRSASLLLAPSLYSLPSYVVSFSQPLVVRLLLLRSAAVPSAEPVPWSVAALSAALSAAAPPGTSVRVESRFVALADWPAAAAALAHSVRTRTSTYHTEGQLRVTVHPYLDSLLVAEALGSVLEAFDAPPRNGERLVRAVVWDVGGSEPLLLDRLHAALAVNPSLVLAVQTNASRLAVDLRCGRRPLSLDPRNATRPLLGALLSAAFGVSASHRLVRSHGADEEALEWAVGRALYGPFSAYAHVTPTLADAARRGWVMQVANASLDRLALLAAQPELEERSADVLPPAAATELARRLLLLRFVWVSAAQALSEADHAAALALVRAAQAEVERIERVALHAASTRRAQLSCPAPRVLALDRALLVLSALFLALGSGAYYASRRLLSARSSSSSSSFSQPSR